MKAIMKKIFELLQDLKKYVIKHNLKEKWGTLFMNYGSIYHHRNQFDSALHYYELAKDELIEKDSVLLSSILNNLGIISTNMRAYEQAKSNIKQSIAIRKKLKNATKDGNSYISLGTVYLKLNQNDSAAIYYQLALESYQEIGDTLGILRALNNLGNVLYYQNKFEKSLEYQLPAYDLALYLADSSEMALIKHNIGYNLIKLNRIEESKVYFDEALRISRNISDGHTEELSLVGLADYYLEKKDFENALYKYVESIEVRDKNLNEKRMAQFAEVQIKYKTAEQELQLKNKELEISKEKEKASRLQLLIILALTMIIISVLVSGFYIYRQRVKNKAELQFAIIREQENSIQKIIAAQEDERNKIAKEIHDGLVQDLLVAKTQLEKTKKLLNPDQAEILDKHIVENDKIAREAREISHQMMPIALRELGLIPAIDDVLERTLNLHNIAYTFEHDGFESRFEPRIEISIFRIIQELINNVIKHSGAKNVLLNLIKTKTQITLVFEDDGVGFDGKKVKSGVGMTSLNSRLQMINGNIRFETQKTGTAVFIRIPMV